MPGLRSFLEAWVYAGGWWVYAGGWWVCDGVPTFAVGRFIMTFDLIKHSTGNTRVSM